MIFLKKKIIIISLIGILLDRISKILVIKNMPLHKSIRIIPKFFYLTHTKNIGAAWSILSGNRILLILIAISVLFLILYYISKDKKITLIESITYGFIISGIIGNLIDRIYFGYVIDFLDFYIFKYDFPIFNIADTLIVLGAVIYVVSGLKRGDKDENKN